MSKNNDIDTDPVRQDNSSKISQIDHRNELFRLLCIVVRLFLLSYTEKTARNVGRRAELLSQASRVPGFTDKYGVAANLDMEERGAENLLTQNNVPFKKPGNTRLYKLEDVVDKWDEPEVDPRKRSAGVAQQKPPAKRRGKTQGK